MTEIWRDIKDYEGLYQVSNWGRVKSLWFGKEKVLQPLKKTDGYLQVHLCKDGKQKTFLIHRLVTSAFLDNPDNLPEVNHKDEVKTNNFVGTPENNFRDGNLEWCDRKYNNNYGTRNERDSKTKINGKWSKPVLQFTLDGEFVREWPSMMEAQRNGFKHPKISLCCQGKKPQYKGFKWEYKKEVV